MSIATALTTVGKLIELISKAWPKRKPTPPKYPTIKRAPKRPLDPYAAKRDWGEPPPRAKP